MSVRFRFLSITNSNIYSLTVIYNIYIVRGRLLNKIIELLIITFGLLNIIEIYPIYNILYFIIIVISLSILIYKEGIIYLSFILIIVYSTALIILFGFIIMKNKKQYPITYKYFKVVQIFGYQVKSIYILASIIIISFLYYSITALYYPVLIQYDLSNSLLSIDMITKIANILYGDPIYIYLILLSTIILLFPIISLLYLT